MTTVQLQLNAELFGALQAISEDESLMKKQTMDETEYIMSSPAMADILREGDEEIAEGKFTPIAIEDLWK